MVTGCNRPILLKKSGLVSTTEKYAPEFEILTFSRGFQTRILRSSVQKRCFHPLVFEHFGETDFFNSIDPKRPVMASTKSGAILFYVDVVSVRAKYIAKLKITRLNVVNT